MSEREFFSDEPTNEELDAAFDGDVPGDDDLDVVLEADDPEDLTDDSESDEDDSFDDSEDEEEDLEDQDEAGDEDEDALPSPADDVDAWLESLDDDERAFVESSLTQAEMSSHLYQQARNLIQQAGLEIQKRDEAIRLLDQQAQIQKLAYTDPEKFRAFRNHLEWAQKQRAQQEQSPEAIALEQARQGMRQYIAQTINREQLQELEAYAQAGNTLYLTNGQQVAFPKGLSEVEREYLFSSRTEPEFDQRALKLHQSRQQQTEAARAAKRQQRTANGQDRGPVRSSGRASGRDNDYDNYDLDRMSDYLDDAQYGRAR